ncbi:hypothetical protein QQS21_009527 [Conoideocrella luteorostrata]|uniref:Uncharacterized protein n=1 Tax=Conoideocrella luteorostrata TaxID=1105319 RepID=A0AAJ0FUZ8_9HYPO|nr:hypothetical protein QQS21_009527 [Conoideocrella luteorostrata]
MKAANTLLLIGSGLAAIAVAAPAVVASGNNIPERIPAPGPPGSAIHGDGSSGGLHGSATGNHPVKNPTTVNNAGEKNDKEESDDAPSEDSKTTSCPNTEVSQKLRALCGASISKADCDAAITKCDKSKDESAETSHHERPDESSKHEKPDVSHDHKKPKDSIKKRALGSPHKAEIPTGNEHGSSAEGAEEDKNEVEKCVKEQVAKLSKGNKKEVNEEHQEDKSESKNENKIGE